MHQPALCARLLDSLPPTRSISASRCCLAAGRRGLGEGSSVAHSAMLLLALAAWEGHPQQAERQRLMAQLAAGIAQQQRKDGSLQASAGDQVLVVVCGSCVTATPRHCLATQGMLAS